MPSLCHNLSSHYAHLRTLTDEFTTAYERVKDSGNLTEVRRLKRKLEEARDSLAEQIFVFRVPDAINPYHEALLEAGLDPNVTQERQEMIVDIRQEIIRQLTVYREAKNSDGHPVMQDWITNISENQGLIYKKVAKDRVKIVERIKNGMIPIVMPSRTVQERTWEDALKYLQPIWMKDGMIKSLNKKGSYLSDKFENDSTKNMTIEGFFKYIPDRPYLVWVKPTHEPDSKTWSKSLYDQQAYYATLVAELPALYDSTDLIPMEYIVLQTMVTVRIRERYKELQGGTKEPMIINPLDDYTSYTRFLSAGPIAIRFVPCANFYTVDRQVRFSQDDFGPHIWGGFRPTSRT